MQCYRVELLFSKFLQFQSIKTGSCMQVLKERHVADPWPMYSRWRQEEFIAPSALEESGLILC